MKRLLILLLAAAFLTSMRADDIPFFCATAPYGKVGQGIYLGHLDTRNGQLGPLRLIAPVPSPGFLALSPNGRFLYAALGKGGNGLAAFRIEAGDELTPLNQVHFAGGVVHLSIDATGSVLFVASWTQKAAAFSILPDGSIGEQRGTYTLHGSGPAQYQEAAHAHSIYPDPTNHFAYVCDLGSDVIGIFKFDASGSLTPVLPFPSVPPGSGPRHLAFGPGGRFVYVNNQMGCTVSTFSRNPASGALTLLQTVSTLQGATNVPKTTDTSEIICHPSGRWLYVGNRRLNSIALFAIQPETGLLDWIASQPVDLKDPVSFAIDPSGRWMVAAGQDDVRLATFAIDPATGRLSAAGGETGMVGPSCVIFAKPPPPRQE